VRFLFNEVAIGLAFVRSARLLTDRADRSQTLVFAQNAHDTIVRATGSTLLTDAERDRLYGGLNELQSAITECADDASR
jgi:hypothetical protein